MSMWLWFRRLLLKEAEDKKHQENKDDQKNHNPPNHHGQVHEKYPLFEVKPALCLLNANGFPDVSARGVF
jgi:hypothetical protein